MYTIVEIKQQGPQVRVKTNPPGGATVSGKLVKHKKSGFVVLHNGHYKVYDAACHLVGDVSAAQWPMKKSAYSSYC